MPRCPGRSRVVFFPNQAKAVFTQDIMILKILNKLEHKDLLQIYFDCMDDALLSGRKVRTIYLDSKYQEDFKVLHILTPIINY